ncbi:MAG: hypothetical protein QXT45_06170 [Candidatus Bilamarchaeaceae archaeon]
MEALGQLTPVQRIEAEIQSKVAEFLGLKQRLVKLIQNPSLEIRSKAQGLYAVQQQLEGQLQEALKTIDNIKKGAWSFGDVLSLTDFSTRMLDQIKNVKSLESSAGGVQEVESGFGLWFPFLAFVVGSVLVLSFVMRR